MAAAYTAADSQLSDSPTASRGHFAVLASDRRFREKNHAMGDCHSARVERHHYRAVAVASSKPGMPRGFRVLPQVERPETRRSDWLV